MEVNSAWDWFGPVLASVVIWLNNNSGAVQAAATTVLVFVTGYYAWQTKRTSDDTRRLAEATKEQARASAMMAEETREQRYDRYRPIVIVESSSWSKGTDGYTRIDAVLSNVGNGSAMNLSLFLSLDNEGTNIDLLPHPQTSEAEWYNDDLVSEAEYWFLPLRQDQRITLGSGEKKTFGFWLGKAGERGSIPFNLQGAFVVNYTGVFDRTFRSVLSIQTLKDRIKSGVCVLSETSESIHDT